MSLSDSKKIYVDKDEYKIIKKDNGDILLKRRNNTITIKTSDDLKAHDFKDSDILSCTINNKDVDKLRYKCILERIYMIIDDGAKIIKNTKLNIKTLKKEDQGFYYLEDIGISVQGVDSNKCLSEIMNQCKINKITVDMKIKLDNGTIIVIISLP
jgi:hypothetical protein